MGELNVLDAALEAGLRKVVFASTYNKTNVSPYVAQAIAGLVYLTFFFALSKYVVFERTRGLVREQPCQHGRKD